MMGDEAGVSSSGTLIASGSTITGGSICFSMTGCNVTLRGLVKMGANVRTGGTPPPPFSLSGKASGSSQAVSTGTSILPVDFLGRANVPIFGFLEAGQGRRYSKGDLEEIVY